MCGEGCCYMCTCTCTFIIIMFWCYFVHVLCKWRTCTCTCVHCTLCTYIFCTVHHYVCNDLTYVHCQMCVLSGQVDDILYMYNVSCEPLWGPIHLFKVMGYANQYPQKSLSVCCVGLTSQAGQLDTKKSKIHSWVAAALWNLACTWIPTCSIGSLNSLFHFRNTTAYACTYVHVRTLYM